ncbi:MAG: Gfo/Idh/MocA family oxidoreductase, partial [Nitrospirales bacterium]
MDPLRGARARHHLAVCQHDRFINERCDLVGVVDSDLKTAQKIAKHYGTKALTDFKQLYGSVDALSIAVPTVHHHAIAMECLKNDIHLLVEKPITTTVEQAHDLIELANSKGRILQVGHIERFNAAVMRLKQIVNRPVFIEGHRLGPYDPRVKDVGVVLDLMIHDLDIILQIVNSPVKSVEGAGVAVY